MIVIATIKVGDRKRHSQQRLKLRLLCRRHCAPWYIAVQCERSSTSTRPRAGHLDVYNSHIHMERRVSMHRGNTRPIKSQTIPVAITVGIRLGPTWTGASYCEFIPLCVRVCVRPYLLRGCDGVASFALEPTWPHTNAPRFARRVRNSFNFCRSRTSCLLFAKNALQREGLIPIVWEDPLKLMARDRVGLTISREEELFIIIRAADVFAENVTFGTDWRLFTAFNFFFYYH